MLRWIILSSYRNKRSLQMEPTKRVPPYLPFKTFLSSLDALSHGVPPKLDRTLWRSQSGVTQGLIMNAYRFFGLVEDTVNEDSSDSSTEYLDQMARHPDKRPEVLRFLIEAQYEAIIGGKHDLTKMTLKMLEDSFEQEFSVSGGTKQKAITFFLKAAKFADMPLSPYLSSLLRATRKKRGPRQRQDNGIAEQAHAPFVASYAPEAASTHSVRLISGGRLIVSITANPFKMPQDDRQFVFSIVDQLQKYEQDHADLIPLGNDEEEEESA
jgi:hypothetical protein